MNISQIPVTFIQDNKLDLTKNTNHLLDPWEIDNYYIIKYAYSESNIDQLLDLAQSIQDSYNACLHINQFEGIISFNCISVITNSLITLSKIVQDKIIEYNEQINLIEHILDSNQQKTYLEKVSELRKLLNNEYNQYHEHGNKEMNDFWINELVERNTSPFLGSKFYFDPFSFNQEINHIKECYLNLDQEIDFDNEFTFLLQESIFSIDFEFLKNEFKYHFIILDQVNQIDQQFTSLKNTFALAIEILNDKYQKTQLFNHEQNY